MNLFWRVVEESAGGILPTNLKIILEQQGYASFIVLMHFDEDDFIDIQKAASESETPFKINNGYKKYLQHFKILINEKGINYFNEKLKEAQSKCCPEVLPSIRKKGFKRKNHGNQVSSVSKFTIHKKQHLEDARGNTSEFSSPEEMEMVDIEKLSDVSNSNLEQHKQKIMQITNNWIKNKFSIYVGTHLLQQFLVNIVNVTKTDLGLHAEIVCNHCASTVKIQNKKSANNSIVWVIANFMRHCKGHATNALKEIKEKEKNVGRTWGRKTETITSYFVKRGPYTVYNENGTKENISQDGSLINLPQILKIAEGNMELINVDHLVDQDFNVCMESEIDQSFDHSGIIIVDDSGSIVQSTHQVTSAEKTYENASNTVEDDAFIIETNAQNIITSENDKTRPIKKRYSNLHDCSKDSTEEGTPNYSADDAFIANLVSSSGKAMDG